MKSLFYVILQGGNREKMRDSGWRLGPGFRPGTEAVSTSRPGRGSHLGLPAAGWSEPPPVISRCVAPAPPPTT